MNHARTWSLSLMALAGLAAGGAQATEYGTIVSSTPVLGQVSRPQRECQDEQVAVPQRSSGGGAVVGALIGGVVGNSVGAGMGRAAATALGAVAGAAIGDRAEANSQPPAVQTVQRCWRTSQVEDRIIGYDVVYDYGGSRRSARLAQDPGGPGTRIALDVSVAPSGAGAGGARVGTPVPPSSRRAAPPAYDDEYTTEAPRVYYSQPYVVASPPVVYAPYPVYAGYPGYYGGPTIWIGGRWGYGGHWHHR
ncbi:MAG TPA: glycine zipper 2TM domain-containing protein [Albitalea sp.]|nr:glycine zipper 2TM domain-containing protein [Albitalea sp.]